MICLKKLLLLPKLIPDTHSAASNACFDKETRRKQSHVRQYLFNTFVIIKIKIFSSLIHIMQLILLRNHSSACKGADFFLSMQSDPAAFFTCLFRVIQEFSHHAFLLLRQEFEAGHGF